MKRYVAEPGSREVRSAMAEADDWSTCRIAFVETLRAIALAAGPTAPPVDRFREEWSSVNVIEVDAALVERAAELAVEGPLRSLDALHLAAALAVAGEDLVLATWDRRLAAAARGSGIAVL